MCDLGDLAHHSLPSAKPQLAYNMWALAPNLLEGRKEVNRAKQASTTHAHSAEARSRLFCPKAMEAGRVVKRHSCPSRSLLLPGGRCGCQPQTSLCDLLACSFPLPQGPGLCLSFQAFPVYTPSPLGPGNLGVITQRCLKTSL